jgi:hypothetical protein
MLGGRISLPALHGRRFFRSCRQSRNSRSNCFGNLRCSEECDEVFKCDLMCLTSEECNDHASLNPKPFFFFFFFFCFTHDV